MVAALQDVLARMDRENSIQGRGYAESLRKQLAELGPDADNRQRAMSQVMVGDFELRHGDHNAAVKLIEEALTILAPDEVVPSHRNSRTHALFQLAVAYLRTAEIENCCARETPDSCIVPIVGGGLHVDRRGSEGAIANLLKVLERTKPPETLYWQSLWLLNIAHMTLEQWPEGVPETYRLPESVFTSEAPFPKFESVGAAAGVNRMSLGGGAIGDDFDGDGDIDIIVSAQHPGMGLAFHQNQGDGTFRDVAKAANLDGLLGGANLVSADYDNDGDLDFFVMRGAWLAGQGRVVNSLVRNNGDGTFHDVTYAAGLGEHAYPTQSAAWADIDLDGDLDLYVANEVESGDKGYPSQLFRNNGDGTFTDVAAAAGVENHRYAKAAVFGDFDGDLDPDLYVSNYGSENRLYKNNGDWTFSDVAPTLGVTGPRMSNPAWFWDYDNDGALDLFVSSYCATTSILAAEAMGGENRPCEFGALYSGDGRGGLRNTTSERGLARHFAPMAGNFADIDNDGLLDFYVGTGHPLFGELMPNRLFVQRQGSEGVRFADVTMGARMGHLQKGHAVVFADFDADGDADVFQSVGGAFPADTFVDLYYRNPGFGHHWISLELIGTSANRSAIGAKVRVRVVDGGQPRDIYRIVNSGGSYGANPLRQLIGLGKAERIESIEIQWPRKGAAQLLDGVPLDSAWVVTEGSLIPARATAYRGGEAK
jgi:hypothetical protein